MRDESFEALSPRQLQVGAALFEALAHPVRLRIVAGLLTGACNVGDMAECLALPQAFVSRHLAILREAGLIAVEPEGRRRVYRVAQPAVAPLVELLRSTV